VTGKNRVEPRFATPNKKQYNSEFGARSSSCFRLAVNRGESDTVNAVYAAIIGLVEGLTEFLPVSSTAHIMLTTEVIRSIDPGFQLSKSFQTTFDVVIQLGAILAVILLYWRALFVEWPVMLRVAVGFFPTGLLGLLLHRQVDVLLGNIYVPLVSLALGGLFLIVFERFHREKESDRAALGNIALWQAFVIGVCQALAMVPGVSRSAATVIAGLALGVRRKTSVEFSFLLAVPTMVAASGLKLFQQFKEGGGMSPQEWQFLGIGFTVSFLMALVAIGFLLRFVQHHTFSAFGYYRIGLVLVFGFLLLAGYINAGE
jgi:undecaprenyl-diphosphatase